MPSTAPRQPQPSRSKTGKVLSPAEHKQRVDAAQAAARRRQRGMDRAYAKAAARGGTTAKAPAGPTNFTAGVGRAGAPGYVDTGGMRDAFSANNVSGADINQSRDPKSGFLNFSGKDPEVHARFVQALKSKGFRVAQRADGSGYAVNTAGQGIRLGRPSNRIAPQPKPQILSVNEETGAIEAKNRTRAVSSRSLNFH